MKRILALMFVVGTVPAIAGGPLYTNNIETGFRLTLGATPGGGTYVAFDDVNVLDALNPTEGPLAITQITFGVRRISGAVAVDVTGYLGEMLDDETLDTASVMSLGPVSYGANGGASVTQLVTYGDGASTLAVIMPNFVANAGYGSFYAGVQLSNTNTTNGWRLTSGPDYNENYAIAYDPGPGTQTAFNHGATGPLATYYIVVDGYVVPEPGTVLALGAGLALIVARRMKR